MSERWEEVEKRIKEGDFAGAGALIGAIARKINPEIADGCGDNASDFCNAIDDCLVNERRPDVSMSMSRAEVLELDLDAARYIIWLKRFHKSHFDYMTKKAFPYKTCGY